ncbi:MAG: PDZ domain-containing protein [Leptolyngbya sp. SIO4C1]|nr:PDZ domain-containing protein [Leptolyngbya sp. SIO4C1]
MSKRFKGAVLTVLLTLALIFGFGSQAALALSDQQKLVMEVWRIVSRAYLDDTFNQQNWWFVRQRTLRQPLNDWESAYAAIQEMLGGLDDPYTRLLPPEQYQSLQTSTAGELQGVGLQIIKAEADDALKVIAPIEGSPAEAAGLKPKDRILKINGVETAALSLDEAAARMRGPAETQVTLTVLREGETPFDVNLVRQRISLNPVLAELRSTPELPKLGYIRLGQFNGNAIADLTQALQQLERQGAEAYILDLRNNPGGLLQAGIEIAKLWLDQGTIVYTVSRQGILDSFEASGGAITQDPLVVLVNEGTASASEILAGALQDNGRAQLVGQTTFGKGLIQSLFDLSHGAGLAVTVAKYETPDHHDINQLGIQPNQIVETAPLSRDRFGTEADAQYLAAVELLAHSTQIAGVHP